MFFLFPLFARHLGASDATIGLLLGTGAAASVVARPVVGAALDRFGRRRVLLWGGALNAASFLPFPFFATPGPLLWLVTLFHCVVWGALFAAYFTYAADLVPPSRRAEGIAVFGVAGMLSNGAGPALGEAIIAQAGYAAFFGVATAFAVVSFALTGLVAADGTRDGVRGPVHGMGAAVRVVAEGGLAPVLVATVLFGVGINAAFFFVAPFTRVVGMARAAPFFVAYSGTSIVLRVFGRRLLDQVPPHRVAVPAFTAIAVGLGGLWLLPHANVLVPAGMACGAGHGTLFPVLNALALSRTSSRLYGTVVSVMTAALDFGGVVGTPLCGALAEGVGYPTMFLAMAGAAVAGLAIMAADSRRAVARPRPGG